MLHVVGLSGGKDSTALALRLRELNPETEYHYICTPTGDELDEMNSHWVILEKLLGQPLIRVTNNGETLDSLIERFGALPNWRQRWCTRLLKIEPTIAWLKANAPVTMYVGLRADEDEREGIYGEIPGCIVVHPLREWEWGVSDVWRYLAGKGVCIPERTDCARCYDQRLVEWKRLWQKYPERYAAAEELEAKVGATFRGPGRDLWPAPLVQLRAEFEKGRKIRGEDKEQDRCRVCSL